MMNESIDILPQEMYEHIFSYISDPITKIHWASVSYDFRKQVRFTKFCYNAYSRIISQEFMHSELLYGLQELDIYNNKKVTDITHMKDLQTLRCHYSTIGSAGIRGLPIRSLLAVDATNIDTIYNLPKLEFHAVSNIVFTDTNTEKWCKFVSSCILMIVIISVAALIIPAFMMIMSYLLVNPENFSLVQAKFVPMRTVATTTKVIYGSFLYGPLGNLPESVSYNSYGTYTFIVNGTTFNRTAQITCTTLADCSRGHTIYYYTPDPSRDSTFVRNYNPGNHVDVHAQNLFKGLVIILVVCIPMMLFIEYIFGRRVRNNKKAASQALNRISKIDQ